MKKSGSINSYRRFWKIVSTATYNVYNGIPMSYEAVRCTVNGKEFTRTTSLNVDYFEPSTNRDFVIEVIGFCPHKDKVAGDPVVATLKRRIKFLNRRIVSDTLLLNDNVRQLSILEKEIV